jgi:hypothetical protein
MKDIMKRVCEEYNDSDIKLMCYNILKRCDITSSFYMLYNADINGLYERGVEDFVETYFIFCGDLLVTSIDEFSLLKLGYGYVNDPVSDVDTFKLNMFYKSLYEEFERTANCVDRILADKSLLEDLYNAVKSDA